MAKGLSELENDFKSINKHWHDIYNCQSLKAKSYSEYIASILANDFNKININPEGVRGDNFKLDSHNGTIQNNTKLKQITEKRVCRAFFNLKLLKPFGEIIDYEVPLTAPDQTKSKKQGHGDIDLLAIDNSKLFLIEAKKEKSNESILKGLLEAFTYSKKVALRKKEFFKNYNFDSHIQIVPTVLVFKDSTSGQQLLSFDKNKNTSLLYLLSLLNNDLRTSGVSGIEFYVVEPSFAISLKKNNHNKLIFQNPVKFKINQIAI